MPLDQRLEDAAALDLEEFLVCTLQQKTLSELQVVPISEAELSAELSEFAREVFGAELKILTY